MPKDSIAVHPLRLTLEAAKRARPDLAAEGNNYLVEVALSQLAGLPPPMPPRLRMAAGGRKATGEKKAHRKKAHRRKS